MMTTVMVIITITNSISAKHAEIGDRPQFICSSDCAEVGLVPCKYSTIEFYTQYRTRSLLVPQPYVACPCGNCGGHYESIARRQTWRQRRRRHPPEAIYMWALAHSWPSRGADRLRELASDFEAGPHPRAKAPNPFRAED
jgi:hypothetical protein